MGRKRNPMSRKKGRRSSSSKKRVREGGPEAAPRPVEPEGAPSSSADDPRKALLRGTSAREVLHRIASGDPLELERRSRARIDERAFLVDVERLVARGLARVAYEARRYNGFPPLDRWLERILDRAIGELLDEDRFAARDRAPADDRTHASFAFLTEELGIAPEVARKVAVVFNDLPEHVRRCYWALAVQRKSPEECAAEGLGSPREVERNAERAVLAMSMLVDPGPGDDTERGER